MRSPLRTRLPLWLARPWWRFRPWWHCRHCGAETYSFRCACPTPARETTGEFEYQEHEHRHVAHRTGEAHCEAPCPRYRRCRCVTLCPDCDGPATVDHECLA